ncbi:glucosyltransferase domain-containing protein [Winslowiella sp. 2C04]|uniref:glucosyltransferase domain-containing protein n=1 Tax=Winslowiella sp. 2C04 TaxID=3416179 RepID=UPI003CF32A48
MIRIDKKEIIIYFSLAMLFFMPLLMAGVYYRDDLDRATTGIFGWGVLGRPLADLILAFMASSSHRAVDIFPYSIIYSSICIALACIMLGIYLARNNVKHYLLISAMLIFNPFFLQNIAYRFDSLGMSAALSLAVFAFAYTEKGKIKSFFIPVAALVASLSTYQTCSNIFIALVALEVLILSKNSTFKKIACNLSFRSLQYVASYIAYMTIVAPFFGGSNARAELISVHDFPLLFANLSKMNSFIMSYFEGVTLWYYLLPALIAIVGFIVAGKRNNSIAVSVISLFLSAFIFYVSLLGPAILLKLPPISPRSFVGFGISGVILAFMISSSFAKAKWIISLPVIASLSFSAQIGNAMNLQREYEKNVLSSISNDLLNRTEIKSVRFVGTINYSPMTYSIVKNRKIFDPFISRASEWLAAFQLNEMGIRNVDLGYGKDRENRKALEGMKENRVTENSNYSVYIKDATAIVVLGDER